MQSISFRTHSLVGAKRSRFFYPRIADEKKNFESETAFLEHCQLLLSFGPGEWTVGAGLASIAGIASRRVFFFFRVLTCFHWFHSLKCASFLSVSAAARLLRKGNSEIDIEG